MVFKSMLNIATGFSVAIFFLACNKIDKLLPWKDGHSKAKFTPEIVYEKDQVWFQKFFYDNDNLPDRVFSVAYFGDTFDYDLKWRQNELVFLNRATHDTSFIAYLNAKHQVESYIGVADNIGNSFFYENDKIKSIGAPPDQNPTYTFQYDAQGNCKEIVFYSGSYPIDRIIYVYDYSVKPKNQIYFRWNDILLNHDIDLFAFLQIMPGLEPKSLMVSSFYSSYHDYEPLEEKMLVNHKYDQYGNVSQYTFVRMGELESPFNVNWRKLK